MTDASLRILHVEDNPSDAEMALRELRKAGFLFEARRVETREAYLAAIADFRPDLILSDYRLPEFDGMQALLLAKEHAPDVPVVITTGSVNEETAVACMKAGAADYVLKEQLSHLGTAVRSALGRQRLILERRLAEIALHRSEAYFRSIIENSLDVIAVLDMDGVVRYASPSVEPTFGYKPEELVGRPIFELIHPEDRATVGSRLRKVVLEGAAPEKLEVRFGHRDGSWRTLSVLGNRLPSEAGVTGMIVNAHDLTERYRLEAQLHHAQKMEAVGRLAGGVAHDFNNLLTVIQGYGELLEESVAGRPEEREGVDEILKAAARASALTRQLLAFSRQQVLERRVLDLGAVVADVEKMLKRLIGEDIEIVFAKPAELGRVKVDPGQIEQVVLNVAVNARDAMPGGGRLTIALADASLGASLATSPDMIPAGRYVVLSMTDTGCGMDAETLSHAFEPFFTTKEMGKGTGLGLATVYGIVRQSGGYVAVASAPGEGTTLRIFMPRCDDLPTASGLLSAVVSRRGAETILVVEDEPSVRALVRTILARQGYRVLVADNAEAALGVASREANPIHLLLTDLVMPGMSGRDLASRMAVLRPSIRIVLTSGYAAQSLDGFPDRDAFAFLAKPFTERTLTAKIREVLDGPRA